MRGRLLLVTLLAARPAAADPTASFPDADDTRPAPSAPRAAPEPPHPAAQPTGSANALSGSAALTERGRRHAAEGRFTEALAAYTEAIHLDSRNGAALVELSRLRLRMGNAREAEQLLGAATRTSDAAAAFAERARLRRSQGRDAEATGDLERAAELAPGEPAPIVELSAAYARLRAWLPALAAWRRFAAEPHDPETARTARLAIVALRVMAGELDRVTAVETGPKTFTRAALRRLSVLGGS